MKRYIEGTDRQALCFPRRLDDYISPDNPVRAVDLFVESLDLQALGFNRTSPAATGAPSYHPATLLKIFIYGYLNREQSGRRLERETRVNVGMMWLTGQLHRIIYSVRTIRDHVLLNVIANRYHTSNRYLALLPRTDSEYHYLAGTIFKTKPPEPNGAPKILPIG